MTAATDHAGRPLRTVLVGFGQVAAGYADAERMTRLYPYSTHAQVLRDHAAFDWGAVVDVSGKALVRAREQWGVTHTASSAEALARDYDPEVAVLAMPPGQRLEAVRAFGNLRAVLVEKPLGFDEAEARAFLDACAERGILVLVNFWRRADRTFRDLAARLSELIGEPQCCLAVYGNGLLNNGTHMVDFARMFLGEVRSVQAGPPRPWPAGPIPGDVNAPFVLTMESGIQASFQAVDYRLYRENSLDIWGAAGRLTIFRSGRDIAIYQVVQHPALTGTFELATDEPRRVPSTVGHAFFEVYDNLAACLAGRAEPYCPGESAMVSEALVDRVRTLALAGGEV